MKFYHYLTLLILWIFLSSCEKDTLKSQQEGIDIFLEFTSDEGYFLMDSIIFTSEAGYPYSVSRLEFFLSDWMIELRDGSYWRNNEVWYVNASREETRKIKLNVPQDDCCRSVQFLIGLPPSLNQHGSLKNNLDNQNMIWPTSMGGGYHFLKLEGHFIDGDKKHGYAMHIGSSGYETEVKLDLPESVFTTLILKMNVDEWFKNPNLYDFNIDGNYSMGQQEAMYNLSSNGRSVFSTEIIP